MAPFLVPLIAGGLDLLAKAVTNKGKDWLKEKTGIDVETASLSNEDLMKLKQFEMDHEEELLKIGMEQRQIEIDLEKAYLKDVDSARSMQVAALQQTDTFSKRFLYYFALGWSTIAALYIFGITFLPIPENSVRFADTILGVLLGTIIAQIVSFFFGSSKSSQDKDKVVAELSGRISK
jgi:hypothetical protein